MSKKSSTIEKTLEKTTGKPVGPYRRLRVSDCAPNDWNPNKMSAEVREKLAKNIAKLKAAAGVIPPIVVRRHPNRSVAKWQIIDGFHRWDIYREAGEERIDGYVVEVDTATAMLLTETLNYLRGSPEPDLHAKYLERMLTEAQMTPAQASEYLPQSATEIQDELDAYDIHVDIIDIPNEGDGSDKDEEDDAFIEVKFNISRTQAEVVERELSRIGAFLEGKNIRGRALEFMAVNSAQTPVENLTGEQAPQESLADLKKKAKKKRVAS